MKYVLKNKLKTIYFNFVQKKKKLSNGTELTYLHQGRKSSNQLIVTFSSLTTERKYAYNYIRTLNQVRCHRLFILDNFGLNKRGVFYLGENGSMDVRDAVEELIREVVRKKNIKKVIFSGSSKGAFAAMYMGIRMNVQTIIVGSPIVYVKTFLEGIENGEALFKAMSQSQNKESLYDELLINTITQYDYAGKIYLQYSLNEEIYNWHIHTLLQHLKKQNYELIVDEQTYQKHEDARLFFPEFLKEKLKICIKEGVKCDSSNKKSPIRTFR